MNPQDNAVAPGRMAHFVLQSNQKDVLVEWYATVLSCEVLHDSDRITFLTFDDEHHRIGIVQNDNLAPRDAGACGVAHIAFTYGGLDQLLGTYERLRDAGITPYHCINHGMSTSMYYADPDGNQIELQIDNYATAEQGHDEFRTRKDRPTLNSGRYDPEEMIVAWKAGEAAALIEAIKPR
jgi:catechol-2,3-dioxygenase